MLLDGCSELLLYATHRLQAATSAVEHSNFDTMSDRVDDLKTWSSAVIALKTTCLDDLLEKPGKVNSTEFPIKINQNSRRLLNAEVDKDGYPAWFSQERIAVLLAFKKTHLTPNVVVAKDGSGKFETIIEAISAYPKNNEGRFIIYVKAGTVVGDGFIASSMGFENVTGLEGEQVVAFHSKLEFSALYNYRMQGYQDTLYYHTCHQFYKNCEISDTVDFIFGEGRALIQDSHIILREPNPNQKNTISADGRSNDNMHTGLVIQRSEHLSEAEVLP
ncbi:hypothetical protein IFM89_035124 [Coptis chinensis]|uniref:Pectinesterase n=1 Tax=Coptis chinensis TaxID=261450 RepID=A0A835IRQ3_9MAGN|nr:hypothetical protein IFM89_035124 [Coptis chinensis]